MRKSKMAENNNSKFIPSYEDYYARKITESFHELVEESLTNGLSLEDVRSIVLKRQPVKEAKSKKKNLKSKKWPHLVLGLCLLILALAFHREAETFHRLLTGSKCLLQNNFLVMEASRPLANCSLCEGVTEVLVMRNVTPSKFAPYAYSARPVLVKGATLDWKAMRTFNFEFFKKIYERVGGAYESVEEECQFFPFRTDFVTLRDVFAMSKDRVRGMGLEKTWYVGWSNCHPEVSSILRQHYSRPSFLPVDSESSAIDWIFMGWPGLGASVHLDYVQRPAWQAQISGKKLWRLFPPPECEHRCSSFNITVEKGDIVLIDTNQWYHNTYVDHGEMSISIGSEYD